MFKERQLPQWILEGLEKLREYLYGKKDKKDVQG